MKKFLIYKCLVLTSLLLISNFALPANERFRSVGSGNWNTSATWEMSTNSGSTWFAATGTPSDTSGLINIRITNTVTVSANVNTDQLTIDSGGVLSVNSSIILNIINGSGNDLTISSGGFLTGAGIVQTQGLVAVNVRARSNFNAALKINSGITTITDQGSPFVSLANNVTFGISGDLTVNAGGTFSPNSNILTMTSGRITVLSGGTVSSSGMVKTQGTVTIDTRNSTGFKANLNISSGTTTAYSSSLPWTARLYGNITVDNGAVLQQNFSSGYTLYVYGNVTNNGTITGPGSGNTLKMLGSSLTNNGSISSPTLSFDSLTTISGSGTYTGGNIKVTANKILTLFNNVIFGISGDLTVDTGGTLSLNSNILTMTSGGIIVLPGGTVSSPGIVKTQGSVAIEPNISSGFDADLNVISGTTTVSSLWTSRLNGDITVDSGAVLSSNVSAYLTLMIFGNIINNGIISGGGNINFQSGSHTLQGTGKWITSANLVSGTNLTLNSSHQFLDVNIDSGATFNISNQKVMFTNTNPIVQNGTFTTTNSKIEYNGNSFQYVSTANISYNWLRINNSAGAALMGDITIPDTLSIISGDLNLNGKIITLTSTAYMTETPGNTIFGGAGYITTTRSINSPSGLNVAGIGAVLTQASNLGVTEIRRGHNIQSGLNGGYSIRRYFDILPTNNSGLNATLVFKYDESELNGKPEPALKLFKSTNSGTSWTRIGGTINIATNEITVSGITSFSRWSADSSGVSAAIALIMEGFYNTVTNNLNFSDTVKAYLRNISAPYSVIDSARGTVDSLLFRCPFQFNAPSGNYYIELRHRNSLETWSKNPVNYIPGTTLNYDFTVAATKAYGDNMKLKGTRYCLYSGDVTQNGFIDLEDVLEIYNASNTFQTGYSNTDVDGNFITDLADILIAYNNSNLFAKTISPLNP